MCSIGGACADDTQWYIELRVHRDMVGGIASPVCWFGVEPSATDGFDYMLDAMAPPHPPGEWIEAVWLRPTWDPWERFLSDWRVAISDGQTKVWPTLTVESSAPCIAILTWTIDGLMWHVPNDYSLTLYDEGTTPDPEGGSPIQMAAPTGEYSFAHGGVGQRRYFHVAVYNPVGAPPECEITYSPPVPTRADLIDFDSHAYDSDGSIVSVAWDFGDGSTGSGITTSHQYTNVGTYLVCATVTDDDANPTICCSNVEVSNALPGCTFTYVPADPVCTDTIDFTAEAIDPDGTVIGYAWDFGDGETAQGQAVSHQYAVGADFHVVCTVTDNDGGVGTCVATVIVLGTPPQACFTEDKHGAEPGETINFDASCTPDPCLTILGYEWDFGDGATEVGETTSHAYTESGTYTVSLTVYDIEGRSDTVSDTKIISPGICVSLAGHRWHLITLPCQPADPDPWEVLDELHPPNQEIDLLTGNLHRYDHANQKYVTYRRETPAEFGPISPGTGYWLYLFENADICYAADCTAAPGTLHFDTVGWYLIGPSLGQDVPVADCTVYHDGEPPLPFADAANVWIQDPMIYYDGTGYKSCGIYPQDNDDHFRAFLGYWLCTFVNDVTLAFP